MLALVGLLGAVASAAPRPSFVLVLTDDQGQAVINAPAHMPTLKRRLAEGGTYFASHAVDAHVVLFPLLRPPFYLGTAAETIVF